MAKYRCKVCGYEYDEDEGDAASGVAPHTDWAALSHTWHCPICGVERDEFERIESPVRSSVKPAASANAPKLLVVGSGVAALTIMEELERRATRFQLKIVTQERDGFYQRPLLSVAVGDAATRNRIVSLPFAKARKPGVEIFANSTVVGINPQEQNVAVRHSNGATTSEPFDTLIMATGSAAFVPPPFFGSSVPFLTLNSLADLESLLASRERVLSRRKNVRWALVGGGMIGCEVASHLVATGDSVSVFERGPRLIARQFTETESTDLLEMFKAKGIITYVDFAISNFSAHNNEFFIGGASNCGPFDLVLVVAGFAPRTHLAKAAGIDVSRGIVVNDHLQTRFKNIFAIGDVAEVAGTCHAFIAPIRQQAQWLVAHLCDEQPAPFKINEYIMKHKILGFHS